MAIGVRVGVVNNIILILAIYKIEARVVPAFSGNGVGSSSNRSSIGSLSLGRHWFWVLLERRILSKKRSCAIIVSLGSEYGGLFSNNDKLSKELIDAGEKTDEKLWRMPLHKNFDKLMDSKNADMQNINYVGGAGSTTAAQFLQRFILNKTPWAHLDIAGMAFSKYGGALNSSGATGYGVRLLNKLVEDNYE